MENRIKHVLLTGGLFISCLCSFGSVGALAQGEAVQVIEPELERRVIRKDSIDTENIEIGAYYGILSIEDFSSSEVYGLRGAYHISEDFFLEATYAEAKGDQTSFEKLSGGSPLLSDDDREYHYYDVSIGWNFLPGEIFIWDKYAFNTQVYGVFGVGSTRFAGDNWFTVNIGVGLRLLLTDWLAWHIDVRDHVFDRDAPLVEEQTTHNLEYHTGFTLFF